MFAVQIHRGVGDLIVEVPLTNGGTAIIDDQDADLEHMPFAVHDVSLDPVPACGCWLCRHERG
jgi:hypothetical protein